MAQSTDAFSSSVSRRDVIRRLAGAALATPFLGSMSSCGREGGAGAIPALTSGYIPILDAVPLIVAYERGFFQEHGVRAEKPVLIRSWPALLEAFTSKQILITHILLPQVMFLRYAQEVPVKSVAFNHTNVVAMLLSAETPAIEDLGGKVVGCPTWWAPHTSIFQDVIRKAGLQPTAGKEAGELADNEVGFRVLPPPDMIEGLRSGSIAGCTVSEPFGAGAEVLAEAKLVKMSGDVWPDHPCCQSVLLEDTLNADRSWSEEVTKAIYRAALWAGNNREELAELLGSDGGGYFPMPKAVVGKALLDQRVDVYGPSGTGAIMHPEWDVHRVDFRPYPFASAFQVTIDLMRRTVVDSNVALPPLLATELTGQRAAHDIVDYDLAKEGMAAAGGFAAFGYQSEDPSSHTERYEVLLK